MVPVIGMEGAQTKNCRTAAICSWPSWSRNDKRERRLPEVPQRIPWLYQMISRRL